MYCWLLVVTCMEAVTAKPSKRKTKLTETTAEKLTPVHFYLKWTNCTEHVG